MGGVRRCAVIWRPGRGLNGAVADGVAALAATGHDFVIIAHGDLPHAVDLAWIAEFDGITLVPDRRDDGTNVVGLPARAHTSFRFAYGSGSFDPSPRRGRTHRHPRPGRAWTPARVGRRRTGRPGRAVVADPMTDLRVDLPTPARALAIGAHPDDIEFGCGATLAKWAAAGCEINHLVLTDGSKGTWDPDADTDALIGVREIEQLAAAKALGSRGKVVMLGAVDGDLESDAGAPRASRLLDSQAPTRRGARP